MKLVRVRVLHGDEARAAGFAGKAERDLRHRRRQARRETRHEEREERLEDKAEAAERDARRARKQNRDPKPRPSSPAPRPAQRPAPRLAQRPAPRRSPGSDQPGRGEGLVRPSGAPLGPRGGLPGHGSPGPGRPEPRRRDAEEPDLRPPTFEEDIYPDEETYPDEYDTSEGESPDEYDADEGDYGWRYGDGAQVRARAREMVAKVIPRANLSPALKVGSLEVRAPAGSKGLVLQLDEGVFLVGSFPEQVVSSHGKDKVAAAMIDTARIKLGPARTQYGVGAIAIPLVMALLKARREEAQAAAVVEPVPQPVIGCNGARCACGR